MNFSSTFKFCILLALSTIVTHGMAATVVNYKFNGNFLDSSGSGNDGTAAGSISFVAGQDGQAAYFDNPSGSSFASQWIDLPNSASITSLALKSFTYALRIRSTDTNQINGRLFGNAAPVGSGSGIVLDYNAGGVPEAYHSVQGTYAVLSSADVAGDPRAYVTDGNWHWIAVVVDRSNNLTLQYVDGSLVSSESLGAEIGFISMSDLAIGRVTGQPHYAARLTAVDEFLLFDTALEPNQIPGVPEPSSYLLWLAGIGTLAVWRRKRPRSDA